MSTTCSVQEYIVTSFLQHFSYQQDDSIYESFFKFTIIHDTFESYYTHPIYVYSIIYYNFNNFVFFLILHWSIYLWLRVAVIFLFLFLLPTCVAKITVTLQLIDRVSFNANFFIGPIQILLRCVKMVKINRCRFVIIPLQ